MENLFVATLISAVVILFSLSGAVGFYAIFGFDDEESPTMLARAERPVFDPNALPAPGAGYPAQQDNNPLSCDGIIYQRSEKGIRYVREAGGGIYYAAMIDHKLGVYRISYGHMEKVDKTVLDITSRRKLSYALDNCEGPFLPSGTHFARGTTAKPRA